MSSQPTPPPILDSFYESYDARRESARTLLGFSLVYLHGYFTDPPATFHPELVHALEDDALKRLLIIGFRGLEMLRFPQKYSGQKQSCCKSWTYGGKSPAGARNLSIFRHPQVWNEDGSLKQVTELDDETQLALCGLEVEKLYDHFGEGQAKDKGTVTKIKLADRGLNLERQGRHFELFTDRFEMSSSDEVIRRLESGRKRFAGNVAAMASPALVDLQLAEEVSRFFADPLGFVMFAWTWGEAAMTDHTRLR